MILAIVIYLFYTYYRKRRQNAPRTNMLNETAEQDKTKDISTDINQAYETIDVHYMHPSEMGPAGSERTAEAIYEFPL